MRTLTTFALFAVLAAMVLVHPVMAEDDFEVQAVSEYALRNIQQVGSFYFLPFPLFASITESRTFIFFYGRNTARDAQIVLTMLAEFKKQKGLEIVHFQLVRNQQGTGVTNQAFGILLKAVPKKK